MGPCGKSFSLWGLVFLSCVLTRVEPLSADTSARADGMPGAVEPLRASVTTDRSGAPFPRGVAARGMAEWPVNGLSLDRPALMRGRFGSTDEALHTRALALAKPKTSTKPSKDKDNDDSDQNSKKTVPPFISDSEPEGADPVLQPKGVGQVEWTVKVDPAPPGLFAAAGAKLSLKMPSLGAIGPDFVESTRLRVLFPATPSRFVALGLNDEKKQFRDVWNLVDKKKVGQVRNIEFGSSKVQALSPDGNYLVGKPQWDNVIAIYGVSQNRPLSPIPLSGTSSKLVAFAGKNRLILEDNKELHVYSVPDFKPKKVMKLGGWKADDGWAVSAGGKYFVAVTRDGAAAGLKIYDLDAGTVAGAISFKGEPECLGAAFSTDGGQLAVLFGGESPQLRVWQVKTGEVAGQFDLAKVAAQIKPRENYQGGRLEWFPDQRHLLIGGKGVYDSRDGKLLSELKSPPIYPVRVISPDQLAIVAKDQLITHDLSPVLKVKATPAAESAKVPEKPVAAPPKPVDRSAAAQLSLEDVEWNVKLGKPPVPVQAVARGVEIPAGSLFMGCLSQSQHGIGFVMYTSEALVADDDGLPVVEPGTRFWLERLDLKSGSKQKNVPLPTGAILMSVSPDGMLVCTQNADGLDRLDVMAVRDGASKGSLAPYHDAPPGPEQRVHYAEFLDPFLLLTAATGRMTLWDFGTNKAQYEIEIGDMRPELSPARDYVAVTDAAHRLIYLLDAKTGKTAGTVTPSDVSGDRVSASSFHPESQLLATLTERIDGGELRVIDLDNGQVKKQIPLPVSGSLIQWVGLDYVLIDGEILVCISRECVVWNYALPDGMHLRDSPDQRHWYIAADPARSNMYVVRGVDMPDENVVQRIGAANPRGKLLLRPGQAISLDIDVNNPEGIDDFAEQVKNVLTDRYLSSKMKVIPGVPVTLKVRDSDSGWSLSLLHEGKPIWSHDIDGEAGPSALLEFEPPKHAFPAGAVKGAGQSTLGIRGTK